MRTGRTANFAQDGSSARMAGLEPDRVVEIYSPQHDVFGSGYLIAPRLVLTAAHVFCNMINVPKKGDKIGPLGMEGRVRLHADKGTYGHIAGSGKDRAQGWHSARRIWPAQDAVETDVMVLEVDLDDLTPAFGGPALLKGAVPTMSVAPVPDNNPDGWVMGYPKFAAVMNDTGNHEGRLMRCDITDLVDSDYKPALGIKSRGLPRTGPEWGGMSGAAVISNNRLLGVVHYAEVALLDTDMIRYEPLSAIFAQPGQTFGQVSGLTMDMGGTSDATPALPKPEQVDRHPELRRFRERLADFQGDQLPRCLHFAQIGHSLDGMDLAVQRFLYEGVYERFLDQRVGSEDALKSIYGNPITLPVPRPDDTIDARVVGLLKELIPLLGDKTDLAPLKHEAELMAPLRAALAVPDGRRAVVLEHVYSKISPDCGEVVRRVAQLLSQNASAGPPVILFSLWHTGSGGMPNGQRLMTQKVPFDTKTEVLSADIMSILETGDTGRAIALPDLGDVISTDVKHYFEALEDALGAPLTHGTAAVDQYYNILSAGEVPFQAAYRTCKELRQQGEQE